MKILIVSDEECPALWDTAAKDKLREYDLIISCGDLKADYLSFLVTLARCPLLYVHGNHDTGYDRKPPLGCDCIDDKIVEYNGIRILGLGGCRQYHPGQFQYTEQEMRRKIRRLAFPLWRTRGVDLVVTHACIAGVGDAADPAHRGFEAFLPLLQKYKPKYWLHGHVHLRYGTDRTRIRTWGETTVINASERYTLEIPEGVCKPRHRNRLLWRNGAPKLPEETLPVEGNSGW